MVLQEDYGAIYAIIKLAVLLVNHNLQLMFTKLKWLYYFINLNEFVFYYFELYKYHSSSLFLNCIEVKEYTKWRTWCIALWRRRTRLLFPIHWTLTTSHKPCTTDTKLVWPMFNFVTFRLRGVCVLVRAADTRGHKKGGGREGGARRRKAERQIVLHRQARPLNQPRLLNCNIACFVIG